MIIRGPNFLQDRIKIAAGPSLYKLVHADIFSTGKDQPRIVHVAQRSDAYYQIMKQRRSEHSSDHKLDRPDLFYHSHHELSPTIIINIVFPGPKQNNMNLVMYYERRIPPAEIIKKLAKSHRKNSNSATKSKSKGKKPANHSNGSDNEEPPAKSQNNDSNNDTKERENSISRSSTSQSHNSSAALPSSVSTGNLSQQNYNPNNNSLYSAELLDEELLLTGVELSRVEAFDRVIKRFLEGDSETRDSTLKIVPRVAEGGWMVKKSVGRVPAILGKKVKQVYYRKFEPENQENYIEIDADLGTSMMAGRIISLIKNTCRGLVVDMSFILQGETAEELPESLMCGIRMYHVDIDNVLSYEENAKKNQYPDF
jgi:hypothetical protein